MVTVTISKIYPSTDVHKTDIVFGWSYPYGRSSVSGNNVLSSTVAIKMFKSLGFIQQAKDLEGRVAELSPQAEKIKATIKELDDHFKWQEVQALQEKHLGNLVGFSIKFEGERYKDSPCEQYLCELTAREKGKEYSPPKSDEFLRHSAKSLAKFEEPYKPEEYLATHTDLSNLYLEHLGLVHKDTLVPVLQDEQKIYATLETLRKYIAAEVINKNVKLLMASPEEIKDNVVMPKSCMCRTCTILLELTIDNQVRYLEYKRGSEPFRFLENKKTSPC